MGVDVRHTCDVSHSMAVLESVELSSKASKSFRDTQPGGYDRSIHQ